MQIDLNTSLSFEQVRSEYLLPWLGRYFDRLHQEKDKISIDGIPGFNNQAAFVAGSVVRAASRYLLELKRDSRFQENQLAMLRDIFQFTQPYPLQTFGMIYYGLAIQMVQEEGWLEYLLTDRQLKEQRRKIDWRAFVDPDNLRMLNGLPANYYQVAIFVAGIREYMGWDSSDRFDQLLQKFLNHIHESSDYGYMDDSSSKSGRFDRYTFLVAAELADMLLHFKKRIPDQIHQMMDRSAQGILKLARWDGTGFPYGRSLSVCGDTACGFILATAARMQLLNPSEKQYAFAYSLQIVKKTLSFWTSDRTDAIDLWDNGRTTDGYRNKNRILTETLGTLAGLLEDCDAWREVGLSMHVPQLKEEHFQRSTPEVINIVFRRGDHPCELTIVREKEKVFALPFIGNVKLAPYFSLPHMPQLIETPLADGMAFLVPLLILGEAQFIPQGSYHRIEHVQNETPFVHQINAEAPGISRILPRHSAAKPIESGIVPMTQWEYRPGRWKRTDTFHIKPEWIAEQNEKDLAVELGFATFAEEISVVSESADGMVMFSGPSAIIKQMECGLRLGEHSAKLKVEAGRVQTDPTYFTPHGALKARVKFSTLLPLEILKNIVPKRIKLFWELKW